MTSRLIRSDADIAHACAELSEIDPRLTPLLTAVGPVPLRWSPDGFEGLIRIILAQQLSVASAEAVWRRTKAGLNPLAPETVLSLPEDALRQLGLSRPKVRTLYALSEALVAQSLQLDKLSEMPGEEAHAALCEIKGIGVWTADLYLLFCLGHPDIFPVGDLALQKAVQAGLSLDERPVGETLQQIALTWRPWRSVAARLFWAYFRVAVAPPSKPVDTELPI